MSDPTADLGATRPARELLDELLTDLGSASTAYAVYPVAHPQCQEALRRLVAQHHAFLERAEQDPTFTVELSDGVTLLVVDEDLVVLGSPWQRDSAITASLVRTLHRSAVERLTIGRYAEAEDYDRLLRALSGREAFRSSRQITVSHLDILPGEGDGSGDTLPTPERALDRLSDALRPLTEIGTPEQETERFARVDRACWQLLDSCRQHGRTTLVHASQRLATDAFWRHGISTALHAFRLASSLGIRGDALADMMLAGLLHDIGRLEVSLLAQQGRVLPPEHHVSLGAQRLAKVTELPALCALVAYEHHLHWDGTGGFPTVGRRPGLPSQIVAVADSWDVLWSATAATLPTDQRLELASDRLRSQPGLQPDLVATQIRGVAAQTPT